MYEHILEKVRSVVWIYGNVTCAGYPLKYIDTISETGEINKDSVLSLVVYGVSVTNLLNNFTDFRRVWRYQSGNQNP